MKSQHTQQAPHPLKIERELRGWSQSKVADLLGTTVRTVIRWEQGDVVPYPFYREQLCNIFGKNAQQLGLLQDHSLPENDEESVDTQELECPSPVPLSFSTAPLPAENFLLDPAIPEMLGRAGNLLGRDDLFDQLKQSLLAVGNPSLIALNGLPGIGKTALAVALTMDRQIQARFPDGILWAELGPEPNVLGQLTRWGSLLGASPADMGTPASCDAWGKALQATIGQRRMLLIIDDAWSTEDAFAFRIGGSQCTHLLTTRLPQVSFAFAQKGAIAIPELAEDDGLALLARFVPQLVEQDPEETRRLVRTVGGLPLGLTLMGKYLAVQVLTQQPRRLQTALAQVRDNKQRLRVSVPVAPGERTANLPSSVPLSLYATIAVSDQQLSLQAKAALRALAVFPPKPYSFSEEEALLVSRQPVETLDALWDAGLLETTGAGRYTLHQTVIDYARATAELSPEERPGGNEAAASQNLSLEQLNPETSYNAALAGQNGSRLKPREDAKIASPADLPALPSLWDVRKPLKLLKYGKHRLIPLFSVLFLGLIMLGMIIPQTFIIHSQQKNGMPVKEADYGPPSYSLVIQNIDPSFQDSAQQLKNTFNAVYPQIVNRFAADPADYATRVVTLAFSADISTEAAIHGMTITINSAWIQQHPSDTGLLTHELMLLVENYQSSAPSWFSDGLADYARDLYGPADSDERVLPDNVQTQDRYTAGGGVTARFLEWLEQHTTLDILDQLNHDLQNHQSFNTAFKRLTHQNVDELWKQYQAHPNIALSPQQLYHTVTSRKPLSYQSSLDIQCSWQGGLNFIPLQGLFMSNFAIQADMTFVQGDGGGGLFFRDDTHDNANSQYRFRLSPDGTYDLVDPTSTLASGLSPAAKQGLKQTNQLTIIAHHHTIYVYINGQLVIQTEDSNSDYGSIGGIAYNKSGALDDVQFKNIRVF